MPDMTPHVIINKHAFRPERSPWGDPGDVGHIWYRGVSNGAKHSVPSFNVDGEDPWWADSISDSSEPHLLNLRERVQYLVRTHKNLNMVVTPCPT